MPDPDPLSVAILAYDGLAAFEFGIATELFALPRPELERWYRARVCAVDAGPMRATGGIRIVADAGLGGLAGAGTIVVPGWRRVEEPPPAPLLAALRRAHGGGARLLSLCSGAFLLGWAGLLDDRPATTHWRYADRFRRLFPRTRFVENALYVEAGPGLFTAAGSAAGIDLCLHLARRDFGAAVANRVARRLVVPPHRDGGQAQLVEQPLPPSDHRFARALDWARTHLGDGIDVAALAAKAGLSRRTFDRRFREVTGESPMQWLIRARLAEAQALLETTRAPVEEVAATSGFATAMALRHHFRRQLGVSPSRYRAQFQ